MKQNFKTVFVQTLADDMAKRPDQYAGTPDLAPFTAKRVFRALNCLALSGQIKRNVLNFRHPVFTRTAKQLGIDPTRKAIMEFWGRE